MGFPLFFPQNQKVVEANGSKYGTSSKTTAFNGPFVQKGWTGSNLSWKLVKNKNYWDKKNVKLNTINYSVQKTPSTAYNLYQSNKLDATVLDAQQTKNLKHNAGYTVPQQWLKKLNVERARIYFTANNPFVFTKCSYLKDYDPEKGGNDDDTPLSKQFVFGINLTF